MRICSRVLPALAFVASVALSLTPTAVLLAQGKQLEPLAYTIRIPNPSSKTFDVDVIVPAANRDSVVLMMAVWSPGMYNLQNYTNQVSAFTATSADGRVLEFAKPKASRWVIKTGGASSIRVSYTLSAPRGSNLSNGVNDSSLVIVGPATYVTLVESVHRPAEVKLELPEACTGNAYISDAERLPTTLAEAAALFEASTVAREAFGDEVVEHYLNNARIELTAYNSAVTDWERRRGFERL
jgi:predicted metalloprotease with PDZ domain